MKYLFVILLLILFLILCNRSKVELVDTTPYEENFYANPYESIHRYYRYNPNREIRENSFTGYDVDNIELYRLDKKMCVNHPQCSLGKIISSDCIQKKMRETGSLKDSVEDCGFNATQSGNCLDNKPVRN